MKITVTVEEPTGDFQKRLLALLAEHAADIELDTEWTVPRAEAYYRSLPKRARRIVLEAVARDGYVPADELRDDENASLRGHSAALTRALQRGFMTGKWPENMIPPIEPQGPGFGKVVGYRMPDDLVPIFFTAIKNTENLGEFDPHDVNGTTDALHAFAEAFRKPIQKKRTTAELHAAMRHPDFEYRTTEGPRKQWDDVDVPPADENGDPDPTWERNTDAGRDGWDRFDYTEESYWRRRKTPATEK